MLNMRSPVVTQIMAQNGDLPQQMNIGYNGYNGQYDGPNNQYVWVNGQPVGTPPANAFPPPQDNYGYQVYGNPALQYQQQQNPYQQPVYYPQAPQYPQNGYMNQGYTQPTGMYNPYQPSYTNYYGNQVGYNYYNPALQQQAMEQQRKAEEQQRRAQIEYMKQISRCAHAYIGEEMSDEELNRIYDPDKVIDQKQMAENVEFERTAHLVQYGQRVDNSQNFAQMCDNITRYHDKFIDPNADLITFLNQAGGLYVDKLIRDEKHKNRNLTGTYNHDAFTDVLKNSNNPYARQLLNSNMEDDVVHLPASIQNKVTATYAERRAKFMQSILSQQRRTP